MEHTHLASVEEAKEIWKDVVGYEEYYAISNKGNIMSKERYVKHNYGGLKKLPQKLRKPTGKRYAKIDLYPDGKQYTIHRLVAKHFIPNPNGYSVVMHKDNNPHNNSVENLMWGTHSMNAKQCVEDGRHQGYETGVGKRRTEI